MVTFKRHIEQTTKSTRHCLASEDDSCCFNYFELLMMDKALQLKQSMVTTEKQREALVPLEQSVH